MIHKSAYPDVEIPSVPLATYILADAPARGDKPAFIDGMTGETLAYAQLADRVERTAAGLAERGYKKGDVLAIFSPNRIEWPIAYYSAILLGGVVTTANPLYTAAELAHQLNDADAKFLVCDSGFAETASAAAGMSGVEEVFVFGDRAEPGGRTKPFAKLENTSARLPQVKIFPDDLAILPYSSGTTGLPKGVMLTHGNLVANTRQTIAVEPVRDDEVLIGILPLYHIYGVMVLLQATLINGGTVVTMPRFDLEHFLRILQDYRVTRAYLVPPIVLALAHHPLVDNFDLSSLNVIVSAAAPIGKSTAVTCSTRLNTRIKQGYGMTELSPVTHLGPEGVDKPEAVGVPIPNTECMVVDIESLEPLGPGQEGEIWIRGPQVMKGYLNQPEATAETITADGWLRTGDIGVVDDEGFLFITDRLKELIKYNAYQVAPAELEGILTAHPMVADAAVIGSPSEEHGEIPKAFVVKIGEITEDEVMDYVAGQVAPQKRVRMVEFVDEIPKAASGKILRRVLRDRERERVGV